MVGNIIGVSFGQKTRKKVNVGSCSTASYLQKPFSLMVCQEETVGRGTLGISFLVPVSTFLSLQPL